METLKVFKAQEQAEACWKSFKERTLTKKTARENLLLNPDFNCLLQTLIGECNERTRLIALEFVINCIKSKIISPVALLTLLQQKLPQINSSKSNSVPVLERISKVVFDIEKATDIDFSFRLASSDIRTIPFLIEKLLSEAKLDISLGLVNFLMGDPDLVLISCIFHDPHYKIARCRLLSHLVSNVHEEEYAELLMTYLIWNSGRQCILELEYLSGLLQFFSATKNSLSTVHLELFEVYLETICNIYFKYGCFAELIGFICKSLTSIISDTCAFQIGSLLLLSKTIDSKMVSCILQLLSSRPALNSFSKVCCAKIMLYLSVNDEISSLISIIFSKPSAQFEIAQEYLTRPFTDFGVVTSLGLKDSSSISSDFEDYYNFIELVRKLKCLDQLDLNLFVERGHFEMIFILLTLKWCTDDRTEVIKGFLKLLGNVENEDPEAKILRYSWVVDFFETNFSFEMYLNYLPLICEYVSTIDNVLFAFVQQKLSQFLSLKDNVSVQFPTILSLLVLFESSQTRQSRLNFLTLSSLSFLHNLVSGNLIKVDSRSVFLTFKLLGKLSDIAVIDPRDIWTKYVARIMNSSDLLYTNFHIRGAIFSFASSLRIIPEGPEGEINEMKFTAIKFLIENISLERDEFVLDQICESLSKFNIATLRIVELALLKPEVAEGEEEKEVPIDHILSNSNIFNPTLLYEISKRYKDCPSSCYKNLWTHLIDYEVETMSRTNFLGSNEKSSSNKPEMKTTTIMNPSFFNGLVFETISKFDCSSSENILKCVKKQFMPLLPSINTLLWYVRPHLPEFILETVGKLFNSIDDQRIKRQLSDYEFLLVNLKSATSPQALSTLLMTISSINKVAYLNQIISENDLFKNWIEVLTKKLNEIPEFKLVSGNEEFLAAFAVSCAILSGCSVEIDAALISALESLIIENSKVRDGVAVYCAIESLSKLSADKIHKMLSEPTISTKRKLVALLSCNRMNVPFKKVIVSDNTDTISRIISILTTNDHSDISSLVDPLEFKGISLYVQSVVSKDELYNKSQQRAFESGSVPAALKYDAIFSYLLATDLDLFSMKLKCTQEINIPGLEASTKDPKSLALLQFVSRSTSSQTTESSNAGLERFGRFSWLKFMGSLAEDFKFVVLTDCKLLPRINWGHVSFDNFNFVLKHVLSVTPITNVPFINPSLLTSFLENAFNFVKSEKSNVKSIRRLIEVLFNNSDGKSSQILSKLLNHSVKDCNDSLLEVILEESLKFPSNQLNFIKLNVLLGLSPQIFAKHSTLISKLSDHLSLSDVVGIKYGKNVFSELQSIIQCEHEIDNYKLQVFSVMIRELRGKERIKAALSVIDLMFINEQSEVKFNILSALLSEILKDIDLVILESRKDLSELEIVNKIKSRSSLLPKDICDRFETFFISTEFDKESF